MTAMQTVKPEILPASPPATPQQLSTMTRATSSVEDMVTTARLMVQHSFVPKHLVWQNNPERSIANCFRVVVQARAWGMDPFAVADNSYVMDGRLEYQGKLVAAVLQKSGILKDRLRHEVAGQGDDMVLTITATLKGEKTPRSKSLRLGDVKTKNQMWGKDDENKLYYTVVRAWARLHCPEIFLGVGASDDIELVSAHPDAGPQVGEVANDGEEIKQQSDSLPEHSSGTDEGQGKTLQEALSEAKSPLTGDAALAPDGVCCLQVLSRLAAARDVLFTLKGLMHAAVSQDQRDAVWQGIVQNRGVKTARAMSNRQALELLANLEAEAAKMQAAKQEGGEKK